MKKVFLLLILVGALTTLLIYQDASAEHILVNEDPPSFPTQCFSTGVRGICADDFVLFSSSTTVNDAHFWIVENPGSFDGIVGYTFYDDAAGMPGLPIVGGSGNGIMVSTEVFPSNANNCSGKDCFKVSMNLQFPLILTADTYWIGIDNVNSQWQVLADSGGDGIARLAQGDPNFFAIPNFNFPIIITALDEDEDVVQFVGGEYFTLDTTALLLAGIQTNAVWIIPVVAFASGIGIFFVRKK